MEFIIILILILLNGIFALSEIALVSARKVRLEHLAGRGDERAKAALKLSQNPDRFLSTVQIGITLIGILLGMYSGEKFKSHIAEFVGGWALIRPYAGSIAVVADVLFITYLSLVLGELIPKRMALARPERFAIAMAGPMNFVSKITFPFIWLLTVSTNFLVKLFDIKALPDNQVTEEEIKAMIDQGTTSGAIEETEQEIIERVFHLGDRNITSLMTHRSDIIWMDIAEDKPAYREKITAAPHSVYPVCEGAIDSLIGVIYIKDLYLAGDAADISRLLKKPVFIPENNSAYLVLEKFKETKMHCGFIVDEYGTLLGMITLNDILEAIVGDMPQPNEVDYEIVKRDDGSYLVDAQIPFYDFLDYFEKEEWIGDTEQQDFDTLAGFILHHLEHIPQTGEKLTWRGFGFEIVDMDGHRIDKILVTPQPG